MSQSKYRLAIAHDALVYRGGAERVVAAWLTRWPEAPVYTSAYLPDATFEGFRTANIRTSFVQRVANDPHTIMRRVFPLMVPGFWSFGFSGYDVVLSSAAYAAKTIRVPESVCHICYCYSPLRLAWRPQDYLRPQTHPLKRVVFSAVAAVLRRWDYRVAQGVDYYATTCRNVAQRIRDCYHREAEVIHAPIEFVRYQAQAEVGDYYLIVSRLFRYKRVDLAIRAMNQLGRPLLIVGEGPQRDEFEQLVQSTNIRFLGCVSDQELVRLYSGCRALIFPQEEDYGLAPLEAQASGRPVIAYGAGGALETIVDGETGVFFKEQTSEALLEALFRAEKIKFDPARIRQNAARFDIEVFCDKIEAFINSKLLEFQLSPHHRFKPHEHQSSVS